MRLAVLLTTLLCIALPIRVVVAAGWGSDDGRWLQQLYASTNGDSWSSSCSLRWSMANGANPCSGTTAATQWARVTCTSGRVTAVNLGSCNLRGTLPEFDSSAGAMSQLQQLLLSTNYITGGFPSSWVRLSSLASTGLQLQGNCLDNGIPASEVGWWNSKSSSGSNLGSQSTTKCSLQLCSAGRYFLNGVCAWCPPGMYCSDGDVSTPCSAGTYSAQVGLSTCTACPAGTYSPLSGQQSCLPCPLGTYNALTGQDACSLCPSGSFTPSAGQTACTACTPGSYNPTIGLAASSCSLQCPPGSYSPSGSPICLPCSPGTFSNKSGAAGCALCPSAHTQLTQVPSTASFASAVFQGHLERHAVRLLKARVPLELSSTQAQLLAPCAPSERSA